MDCDFRNVKALEEHLEDKYGTENVAKIGTYTTMGVKSGLKDVCRALGVSFADSNAISKRIDDVCVGQAQPTFADYDALENGTDQEKEEWLKFNRIEKEFPEYFRLARAFEGSPKNFGVHASGVLVTPMPITDMFPTHRQYQGAKDSEGIPVTLWTGPQLEHLGCVKYDVLGLASLDIFYNTLKMIDKDLTFEDLYNKVDINDQSLYGYVRAQKTEGVFQLESDLMKGLIKDMKPTGFNDIVAINATARPGPLAANFHKLYGEGKKGNIAEPPIRGCEDILGPTYNVPIFQEQLMLISKKVSGFDDMQADSITRKITAKKKRELFPMMIRCHIYGKKNCEGPEGWENDDHAPWYDPKAKYGKEIPGALVNGYTEQELLDYFHKIEGFASYSFNRSHAACYAYLGIIGTYLKKNYPEEYMCAVLNNCKDAEAQAFYINVCENSLGIKVLLPDINNSKEGFSPDRENHTILYGLGGIKGVGAAAVPAIIKNAPYAGLKDAYERIPKSSFNRKVAEALIKAGAFESFESNRIDLLNELYTLRNDRIKENGRLVRDKDGNCIVERIRDNYSISKCMEYEKETLGCHITYRTWWETLKVNEGHTFVGRITAVREYKQRNGGTMAFITLKEPIEKITLEGCAFSKIYKNIISFVYGREGDMVTVSGKKGEKGKFIINDIKPFQIKKKIQVAS